MEYLQVIALLCMINGSGEDATKIRIMQAHCQSQLVDCVERSWTNYLLGQYGPPIRDAEKERFLGGCLIAYNQLILGPDAPNLQHGPDENQDLDKNSQLN